MVIHTRLLSNHECFPANYSLILHTVKLFHLERFAIYGNVEQCEGVHSHKAKKQKDDVIITTSNILHKNQLP